MVPSTIVLVLQHRDVDVVRMLRDMPVEHLGQGLGVGRLADQHGSLRWRRRPAAAAVMPPGAACSSACSRSPTVSISATWVIGKPHAEFALDAQHQLGAAEAVDAEIAVEPARQRHVAALEALR